MDKENKPFNGVIDHMQKIEGNSTPATTNDNKKLPKLVRYIAYFIISFLAVSALLLIILNWDEGPGTVSHYLKKIFPEIFPFLKLYPPFVRLIYIGELYDLRR